MLVAVAILIIGRFWCDGDRLDPCTKQYRRDRDTGFATARHNRGPRRASCARWGGEWKVVARVVVRAGDIVPAPHLKSACNVAVHVLTLTTPECPAFELA